MIANHLINTPYWWEDHTDSSLANSTLSASADVVVIGSGFTGSSAALELARAGKDVLVVDAESIGFGTSSRNFGYLVRPGLGHFSRIRAKYGECASMAVKDYYAAAYQYSLSLIETDLGDCGLTRHGQSVFAHSKKAYQFLKMELDHSSAEAEECRPFLLDRDHVCEEAGTDIYQGALVYPGLVSVDPGRYHHSLVEAAQHAGARFVENCHVNDISFSDGMFTLSTVKRTIKAGNVFVATNGHTGSLQAYLQRRVVPVTGTVIATEVLSDSLMDELLPQRRSSLDTRVGFHCFRPSVDGKRLIYAKAGCSGSFSKDIRRYIPTVYMNMLKLYPQLEGTDVEYAWPANAGVTFDGIPHIGEKDGVHFALGLNGMGVAMGTFLGHVMAQRLTGQLQDVPILEQLKFPSNPLYFFGKPWFMPYVRLLLRAMDLST